MLRALRSVCLLSEASDITCLRVEIQRISFARLSIAIRGEMHAVEKAFVWKTLIADSGVVDAIIAAKPPCVCAVVLFVELVTCTPTYRPLLHLQAM